MPDVTQEQIAASESAVPESETTGIAPAEPVVSDATEQETDEQRNERATRETQERAEKRARGVQKRLDELTADKYAERAAREAAERRSEQLMAMVQGRTQQTAPPETGEPKREQFTDYEEFVAAKAEYRALQKADQLFQQRQAQQQRAFEQQRMQATAAQVQQQFRSRVDEYAKSKPDFADLVTENTDVRIPDETAAIVQMMDDGPAILYHMGKNPEIARQLWGKPAMVQAMVLGQLSASIKSGPAVSSAPAPGKPVGAKSGSSENPPSDMDGYMRWRAKQRA